jgi:hypothetical protein
MRRVWQSSVARTGLLRNAERAHGRALARLLLGRCLCAWREPAWRSRREAQKRCNVASYRFALWLRGRRLLAKAFLAWRPEKSEVLLLARALAAWRPPRTFRPPPGLARWQ